MDKMEVAEKHSLRVPEFDILKGIGIISMIIGHRISFYFPLLHAIIYSFHMPLFCFISGYFFKPKPIRAFYEVNMARFIYPFIVLVLLLYLKETIKDRSFVLLDQDSFNSLINAAWFIVALFFALFFLRTFVKSKYLLLFGSIFLPILGIWLYKDCRFHSNICLAMTMFPFLCAGYMIKRYNYLVFNKFVFLIFFLIWILSILFQSKDKDIYTCTYSWWFFGDIITSFCAFYVLYHIVSFCKKLKLSMNILRLAGVYSFVILWIHALEQELWGFPWIGSYYKYATMVFGNYSYGFGSLFFEFLFILIFVHIVSSSKILRSFFGINERLPIQISSFYNQIHY